MAAWANREDGTLTPGKTAAGDRYPQPGPERLKTSTGTGILPAGRVSIRPTR
jgi:hypothetical protein